MRIIYQLGNVPLYGALANAVSLSENSGWTVKQTSYQQVEGVYTHTPVGRRITEQNKITIDGTLISTSLQHLLQISARLKAVGGYKDIPLIVFDQYSLIAHQNMQWLYTRANVTDIKMSSEYNENSEGYFIRKITIDLIADANWRPLLPVNWEYRPMIGYAVTPTYPNSSDNLFVHPTNMAEVKEDYYFQEWSDTLSPYSPSVWNGLYQGTGYGFNYVDYLSLYILQDSMLWSGTPSTVYAFTGILPQGTLSITVGDSISTLDLADLDDQLSSRGYQGLQLSDEIFVGDTKPFCSFIRRNDEIIANFIPQWRTDLTYPGELKPGLNSVTIEGIGTTGSCAMRCEYRTL